MNLKITPLAVLLLLGITEGELNMLRGGDQVEKTWEENKSRQLGSLDDYQFMGNGGCFDQYDRMFKSFVIRQTPSETPEDCARKCNSHSNGEEGCDNYCIGFVYHAMFNCCILQFNGVGENEGKCKVVKALPGNDPVHRCYRRKDIPVCPGCDGGVNADPLILGLRGQVFKFDGRNEAWYANIATKHLQWNLQFGKFTTCPRGSDMFVTGTSMMFFDKNPLSKKDHSIVIKLASKNEYYPGCPAGQEVCLANGTLIILIDGEYITAPGDYTFSNGYGRVIVHNTFASCSRKWYDFRNNKVPNGKRETIARNLQSKNRPIDYLIDDKEKVLDPYECRDWMDKRIQNDDLFDQNGNWATVHIETPLVSFHVEYRKNKNMEGCMSHSIDGWISNASPELEEQKWHGILGETAQPKFNSNGNEIKYGREFLSAADDEAYEVEGEFGTEFKARVDSRL